MAYDHEKHGDVDIIFAGGGTAACVAAGRLAKANPTLKVLLIEGGPNNFQEPTVVTPAMYLTHLAPDSKTALFYTAKPSDTLNGRSAVVPSGGMLGGGSSINFMMYTRAQGIDFDSWNTPGWTAKDMLPLLRKLETFHPNEPGIDSNKHGYEGPIHVSDGGFRSKSEHIFLSTIKDMGMKEIIDLQDLDQVDGWSRWQRYVSPTGKRQDAAHCYIHPLIQSGHYPNLHYLVNSKVVRVLFDEQQTPPRAVGVEYIPDPESKPLTSLSKPDKRSVKAKKLVVVSAGALGSPQILERSGVGSPKILESLKIKVVSEVPGVGEQYQDHHLILYPYKSNLDKSETLDELLSGRKSFQEAIQKQDPRLGWNAIDVAGKLRMTEDDAKSLGSEFHKDWERDFAPHPSRPIVLGGVINTFLADPSLVEPGQYFTIGIYTAYPYSRGSIHINSPDNVINGYDFDTGFLNHPSDIKKQLWAYKKFREITRRLPFYEGELELGHPEFPTTSKAVSGQRTTSTDSAILQYSKEDDDIIENWIRDNLNTTWHSLGTCAMKPLAEGGVVNGDLNVYGTSGLKVADISIAPENVGANTNNTALVIGEKAATIIARELKLVPFHI